MAHTLCGQLDGAAFRYLLSVASLVDCMPWTSIKEFSPWVTRAYPAVKVCVCECVCVAEVQMHINNYAHSTYVCETAVYLLVG